MPYITTLLKAVDAASHMEIDNVAVSDCVFCEEGQLAIAASHSVVLELVTQRSIELPDQPISIDDNGCAIVRGTHEDQHYVRFVVAVAMKEEHITASAGFPAGLLIDSITQ